MTHAGFVHLRVHSAYSLSEGAIKVKDLIKLAVKHGMPAVAVTDTGNLFGALEFSQAAADAGVQPIIGCLLALRRTGETPRPGQQPGTDQILLLAQNEEGYRNLLKLVSKSFIETIGSEAPQIAIDDLEGASQGLIALAGLSSPVGRFLGEGRAELAEAALARLAALFETRLYIELQRHNLPTEARVEEALIDLAYAQDLPLVATNDVYFAGPEMHEAHDALLCIAEGVTASQPERRRVTADHHFKSEAAMRALFADLPEAIDNTIVIARRCAYMPKVVKPILPAFVADGGDEGAALRAVSEEGLTRRLAAIIPEDLTGEARAEAERPYRERLSFELDVIAQMGFAGYFLIVADFIQWAKRNDIPVGPGRGSGAGSVVAWSLTITDPDPLRFGLLFERFLNPERVSMPDFDIDFCQERRDEVIRYVQNKYGHDRVAQIITFGKLQARAVLRDVGRVLEMPYGQVDRICKLVPNNPAKPVTLAEAIEGEVQLQTMRDEDEQVQRLIAIALKLEGLYRHASTHAAGVVIGDRPLERLVPLYRDPRSDMPVTQFNMKYVELAGLVKFDFLGLKTLDVLDATRLLLLKRGVELDLGRLPLDDGKTFDMLGRGEVVGVFQFESGGMRDLLRRSKPRLFEDLIALVALYRPGPMENIPKYIACKHGTDKPEFMHETISPVVEETYGIIVYQEQVLRIAQVFAGYSLGGADILRRAMGKKIKSEMDEQRAVFVKGAVAKHGVTEAHASQVFDLVDKFAGYGFNKAHAACYALVAYQTAYLKANHPIEFLAASMTLDLGNTDKLNVFRQELSRLGISLLPPDVNKSGAVFTVDVDKAGKPAVRYALAAVRNVGDQAMRALVAEREAGGVFEDLGDFARRLDAKAINRRQLENLVAAGAFDSLEPNRARMTAEIDMILREASAAAADRESDTQSLFGAAPPPPQRRQTAVVADWSAAERLQKEFDAVGFYLSAHPLDEYATALGRLGVTRSNEIGGKVGGDGARLKLAGILVSKQERTSARGSRFGILQLSDATGQFEVTLFSEILAQTREMLEPGRPLLISADARIDGSRGEGEQVRMTAQAITPLDDAAAKTAAGLRVFLNDAAPVSHLRTILDPKRLRGTGKITLVIDTTEAEVEIALPGGFAVSPQIRRMVKEVKGVLEAVEV